MSVCYGNAHWTIWTVEVRAQTKGLTLVQSPRGIARVVVSVQIAEPNRLIDPTQIIQHGDIHPVPGRPFTSCEA
jgi:hypothetical protein